RAPSATAGAPATTSAARTPQADPFEPPPPGMSAAQIQARTAGAVSPATANAYDASGGAPAQRQPTVTARAVQPTPSAPDAIDAAADAFEPPPAASVAARQARQAQQAPQPADEGSVQIMRASTASRGVPAPSQTNDDPIARFANGKF
ncbi:MAG TPA: peptidoglycan endopeptidase, partial [Paraburkholderia sp.]